MPFDNDIFISYAHIDNESWDGTTGWIENLFKRLKVRLAQLLGREPTIWWDRRLQGDVYLTGVIGDELSNTLLLVPVVTPRYLDSVWCQGELREFCERAAASGGVELRNYSRIFKVLLTPLRKDQRMPQELDALLGYAFYELDEIKRPRFFSQEVTPAKDPKYWAKLDDLAWDIKTAIENLKSDSAPAPTPSRPKPLEKKVYLAETTADLSAERDRIRRELQQRDYYVLPDKELPLRSEEFKRVVSDCLQRSMLSIHLIGQSYGLIPDGEEERSIIRLQEELAAERQRSGGSGGADFSRLIWMPVGLEGAGRRQQEFIQQLQTGLGPGAELLQTSVEDLKTRILEKLNPPPPRPAAETNGDGLKRVYLICDNRDLDYVTPIEEFLFDEGYEVIPSINEGDSTQVAQYHRESLLTCDATLIYYGNANQLWLRSKLLDLQKAQGWGRTQPLQAKAIYVGAPATDEKRRFRTREALVMQNQEPQFSPAALKPFLAALGSKGGNGGAQR